MLPTYMKLESRTSCMRIMLASAHVGCLCSCCSPSQQQLSRSVLQQPRV